MSTENRYCHHCHHLIRGRTDKKFCNDYCRNSHHNRLNSEGNRYVRNINHCLLRNRRILENFFIARQGITAVSRHTLLGVGFSFRYFTHSSQQRNGQLCHFCYEYGYVLKEKDMVGLVKVAVQELVDGGCG